MTRKIALVAADYIARRWEIETAEKMDPWTRKHVMKRVQARVKPYYTAEEREMYGHKFLLWERSDVERVLPAIIAAVRKAKTERGNRRDTRA